MLTNIIRVTCDNCGDCRTFKTGDSLEATRLTRKAGWVVVSDFYGNEAHYCDEDCRANKEAEIHA